MPIAEEPKIEDAGTSVARPQTGLSVLCSTLDSFEFWPGARTKADRSKSGESFPASALPVAARLRAKWFWYSLMSLGCWTAWALTAKIGSSKLPPSTMQFVSALGFLFVSIAIAGVAKRSAQSSHKGKLYSVISGVLLAGGGLASFAAYRTGGNTAATTGITSLYPAITVICAFVFLKERLTKSQIAGLCFSALAILLFSF
jgi:uncharacterized membrane protein